MYIQLYNLCIGCGLPCVSNNASEKSTMVLGKVKTRPSPIRIVHSDNIHKTKCLYVQLYTFGNSYDIQRTEWLSGQLYTLINSHNIQKTEC